MAISVKEVMQLSKTDLKTVSRLEEHFDNFLETEWRTPQSYLQIQESIKLKTQIELQKRYAKVGWTVSFHESTNNYNQWFYTNSGLNTVLNSNVLEVATNGKPSGDITISNAIQETNQNASSGVSSNVMSMMTSGTATINCYPWTYQRPTIHTTVSFVPTIKTVKTVKKTKKVKR